MERFLEPSSWCTSPKLHPDAKGVCFFELGSNFGRDSRLGKGYLMTTDRHEGSVKLVGRQNIIRGRVCRLHRNAREPLSDSFLDRHQGIAASPSPQSDTSAATIFCRFRRLQDTGRRRRTVEQIFNAETWHFLICSSVRGTLDLDPGTGGNSPEDIPELPLNCPRLSTNAPRSWQAKVR